MAQRAEEKRVDEESPYYPYGSIDTDEGCSGGVEVAAMLTCRPGLRYEQKQFRGSRENRDPETTEFYHIAQEAFTLPGFCAHAQAEECLGLFKVPRSAYHSMLTTRSILFMHGQACEGLSILKNPTYLAPINNHELMGADYSLGLEVRSGTEFDCYGTAETAKLSLQAAGRLAGQLRSASSLARASYSTTIVL